MIISSASRLRAKRRQHRLARKASFALIDFAIRLHHDKSVDERAGAGPLEEDLNDEVHHELASYSV